MAKTELRNEDAFRLLAEKLKSHATRPNIYGYKPHDKQQRFHNSDKKVRLYIGGNRSGKTVGGVVEDLWWATKRHPFKEWKWGDEPCRGRIVTVDFLNGWEKIIKPEIARWVPPSDLRGGSWDKAFDKQEKVLWFENGGFIEIMSYDQDLDKFAGTSRHFVHFDEEPPQDIYTECMARLVDTGGHAWLTMTPVEGMTWVYDTIYEKGVAGDSELYDVIEVSMTENPYLNANEITIFLDSLDDDERKAREHGKFVQLGGLIYKDFDPESHVVAPMVPPKDWTWVCSLDHGFNNPTAWLWHAVSPDGQVVTFYEHYLSGWTVDQHAAKVHSINKELGRPPDYYIGDPSIRNTDPITGTSIHEEYIKYGVPITLANNDVDAGIIRVARYLRTKQANGKPQLVITDNCENLIRELRRYRWATFANKTLQNKNNAQEKPHKKDDHACDSLRYFIMSRPDLTPDMPTAREPVQNQLMGATTAVIPAAPVLAEPNARPTPTVWHVEGDMTGWESDDMGAEW